MSDSTGLRPDSTRSKGRLGAVEGGLAGVQVELSGVHGELAAVQGRLVAVEGGLASVQGRLGSVEGGLSQLTETVHQQGLRQEYLIDKVTLTMEGVIGGRQVLDERFAEVMAKLDKHVRPKPRG